MSPSRYKPESHSIHPSIRPCAARDDFRRARSEGFGTLSPWSRRTLIEERRGRVLPLPGHRQLFFRDIIVRRNSVIDHVAAVIAEVVQRARCAS